MEEIRTLVLAEYAAGNIVVATHDGFANAKLSEIIKQPSDGLLYDLNRSEEVILTFIDDPKWVNDFACAKIIRALKDRIVELEKEKGE